MAELDECHSQRVVISCMKYTWKPVTTGVSQGLTVGPILFRIFINDLREPQRDCNRLQKRTNRNLMKFNSETQSLVPEE